MISKSLCSTEREINSDIIKEKYSDLVSADVDRGLPGAGQGD